MSFDEAMKMAVKIVSDWNIVDINPLAIDKELLTNRSKFIDLIQTDTRDLWIDSVVALMMEMPNLERIITIGTPAGQFALE